MSRNTVPISPSGAAPTLPPAAQTLRIRPTGQRGGTLLVDIPIGARLTLSFMICALIAALVTGIIGFQRSQSLNRQSEFYQTLLQTNITLTTGEQFLQAMQAETQDLLSTEQAPQISVENINGDRTAITNLVTRYNTTLNNYIAHNMLYQHPDQIDILTEANGQDQVRQQETLAASAQRTWQVSSAAQQMLLQELANGQLPAALKLQQLQVQPTNADALSALRSLTLFNQQLSRSVQQAANVEEQNLVITTIISSIIAFIAIILIGWLISSRTITRRLRSLRAITQAVEGGNLQRRIAVIGRDEIGDVSASVNAMLDTIVGLLEETRSQRDALSNAAEHLFSDMRVVSAGDLRVNAPVSDDPIGLLANAFNFTVGRFRRFVLRTKTAVEQLDVIARQEIERADAFTQAAANSRLEAGPSTTTSANNLPNVTVSSADMQAQREQYQAFQANIRRVRERLQLISQEGIQRHTNVLISQLEQLTGAIERLNKMDVRTGQFMQSGVAVHPLQELRGLETLGAHMLVEVQSVQKKSTRSIQDLDRDLGQLSATLRAQRATSRDHTPAPIPPTASKEQRLEFHRQSLVFANDITALARQISILAQEMRTGVISFQLEGVDNANAYSAAGVNSSGFPVLPEPEAFRKPIEYNLASDMERHSGHPPQKRIPASVDERGR